MMKIMDPSKKYLTYFEYSAAHLYYSDVKLHLLLDQTDSGFHLEDGEWESGVEDPLKKLNFNTLWNELNSDNKQFYLELARHNLYSDSEIKNR